MNLSGNSVKQAMSYHKINISDIIVVSDDVALPPGKLRIRRSGSAGGHNGLKDIIAKCGSDEFPRLKIGVGSPPNRNYDMADWVLAKLTDDESKQLLQAASAAADAVVTVINEGLDKAMIDFN